MNCSRLLLLAVLLVLLTLNQEASATFSSNNKNNNNGVMQDLAEEIKKERAAASKTVDHMIQHSTLAGNFKPLIKRLIVSKAEATVLWKALKATTHWEDLALIVLVGWLSVPVMKFTYEHSLSNKPFSRSKTFMFTDHLQQIARIAFLVYLVDILKIVCIGMGFDFCSMGAFPHAFAQSAYTLWAINRVTTAKKYLLRRYVSVHPETYGRMQIINRLLDAAIYGVGLFIILNILQVEMGVAMHSFLAFGSVGTLAVGLASQGIAQQILHGLMLASSDRIYEGDKVRFSNGPSGTIHKLGWMETVLRGSDEIMVSIPNADLAQQHVSNLSRVCFSQVEQTLRFKYSDLDKLPNLLKSIKEEIKIACPAVITDGSRPFRAHWVDYGEDYLEVQVVAHFRIKPIGDEYWENRQRFLQAIDKAVKKNAVSFVAG